MSKEDALKQFRHSPRIKKIYPAYRLDESTFRIGAQLGLTAEFNDPDGHLWSVAQALDGRPLEDVVSTVRDQFPSLTAEDVREGIAILDREGFIEEAFTGQDSKYDKRLIPNINYFSRFAGSTQSRHEFQNRLSRSNILLLGLGGGGANVLTMLSGLGPKSITVVDHDRVEPSNMGRQVLYRESDVGALKVEAAINNFHQMNSGVEIIGSTDKIVSVAQVADLAKENDIIISCIDEPPFKIQRVVNAGAVAANKPCVFGASQVSRGRVFTIIPGLTGCFDCLMVHYSERDPQFVAQFEAFQGIDFDPPSMAYAPSIFRLTSTLVDEAVRVLTGYAKPISLGCQLELNFEDHTSFTHPTWPRTEHQCPTCGSGSSNNWPVLQTLDLEVL